MNNTLTELAKIVEAMRHVVQCATGTSCLSGITIDLFGDDGLYAFIFQLRGDPSSMFASNQSLMQNDIVVRDGRHVFDCLVCGVKVTLLGGKAYFPEYRVGER